MTVTLTHVVPHSRKHANHHTADVVNTNWQVSIDNDHHLQQYRARTIVD